MGGQQERVVTLVALRDLINKALLNPHGAPSSFPWKDEEGKINVIVVGLACGPEHRSWPIPPMRQNLPSP